MTTVVLGSPCALEKPSKVDEILMVARVEFARLGYRGVTMRGVAEKSAVSTRTIYNNFSDKLDLFTACIDAGATHLPKPKMGDGGNTYDILHGFAKDILRHLSSNDSLQISLIIFRDGDAFPEIRDAAKNNDERYVVTPLANFLSERGADQIAAYQLARLFSNMATSEWQRRILFGDSVPTEKEIEEHAKLVTSVFLGGAPSIRST